MTDAGQLLDELVSLLEQRDRIDSKLAIVRSKIREQEWYHRKTKGVIAQEPTVPASPDEEVPRP